MQLVSMFRILSPMDSGSNLLSIIRVLYLLEKGGETPGPIPLRERGRDFSPRQTNNEGPEGIGLEEFFNDFSNRRGNIPMHSLGS